MRWARCCAWRVETVQAAICFKHRGLGRKRRVQVRKALRDDGVLFAHRLVYMASLGPHKISIQLWSPVPEELPRFSHLADLVQVEIRCENFVPVA
jgi:hypothetical protein